MTDAGPGVEISDRNPAEMSHDELAEEWKKHFTRYHEDPPEDANDRDALYTRFQALWSEMERRVDPDYPPCPECGATGAWSQSPGEPKACLDCSHVLDDSYGELAVEIDNAWTAVVEGGVPDDE